MMGDGVNCPYTAMHGRGSIVQAENTAGRTLGASCQQCKQHSGCCFRVGHQGQRPEGCCSPRCSCLPDYTVLQTRDASRALASNARAH